MKKYLDLLEKTIMTICVVLFSLICILIMAQVYTRYVVGNPLSWSEQAARIMFIWLTLLYAGVLVRNGANLGFDIITNKMPAKVRHICVLLTDIGIIVFSAFWLLQGFKLCQSFVGFSLSGVKIPYNAVYSAEPIGAAIICIFAIEQFIGHIKSFKEGGVEQ